MMDSILDRVEEKLEEDGSCREGIYRLLKILSEMVLPTPSSAKSEQLEKMGLVKMDRRGTHVPTPLRSHEIYNLQQMLQTTNMNISFDQNIYLFITAAIKTYPTEVVEGRRIKGEDKKTLAILPHIQKYFDTDICVTKESMNRQLSTLGMGRVDVCTYLETCKFPVIVWEIKNEETSNSKSDAASQAITYYLQSVRERKDHIIDNFPCIIISLRGTVMSIRTVVLFDGDFPSTVESLLFTLDLCQPMAEATLQSCFVAMKEFCQQRYVSIMRGFDNFLQGMSRNDVDQCRFPTFQELPSLSLRFTFLDTIAEKVYSAEVHSSSPCQLPKKELVVKFVRGDYCQEAHYFLAQQGYAPALYGVHELGYDSWKVVVMEKIKGKMAEKYKGKLTEDHRNQESTAITLLHQLGYVHGDLRDSNIMISNRTETGSKLYIIDFDWCNKKNSLYKRELNTNIHWHETAAFNKQMITDHDMHFHNKRYEHLSIVETLENLNIN